MAFNNSSTATTVQVGFTSISGGTTGRVLYDNAGTLGEYPTTGSAGSVVLSNNPQFGNNLGIGAAPGTTINVYNAANITGGTYAYSYTASGTGQSDVTNTVAGYHTNLSTQATSYTLSNLRHFWANQGTIGVNSTVTNQFGFHAANSLTGATNNYGFYSDIASGSNRYNFYANGTADNFFRGNVTIGSGSALKLGNAYVPGAPAATGYVTLQDSAGTTYKVLVST